MHYLFTTKVYQKKVSFDLKDLKTEILQIQKADHQGRAWSEKNYPGGYTSYGSWDQLQKMSSTFLQLSKKIDRHIIQFLKNHDYEFSASSLKMNSCWVNIMPSQAQHTSHIHPHSVVSGTFYVDTPPLSSALKFEDPRLGLFMNSPRVKDKAQASNQRFFSIHPKASDLVLFESWLRHEVPLNKSKKPRISVSFNYGWN